MSSGLRLYCDFVVFVLGAVIGSFLNVCIHRMPREESVVTPPSHCPHCGQRIRWSDNIPLVSWLALGGKCRYCRAKITPRYFLVELLTAALFLGVWLKHEQTWLAPVYWVLVAGLIVATFIDFEHYIIPNEITFGGVVAGVVFSLVLPGLQDTGSISVAGLRSLAGILAGGLTLFVIIELGKLALGRVKVPLPAGTTVLIADEKIKVGEDPETAFADIFSRASDRILFRATSLKIGEQSFENVDVALSETTLSVNGQDHGLDQAGTIIATTDLLVIPREAMGMGDMKLMAGIGAFLGWKATVFSLMIASCLGSLLSLLLFVVGLRELRGRIPFGPYIAVSALLWILGGREMTEAYFAGLFGGG